PPHQRSGGSAGAPALRAPADGIAPDPGRREPSADPDDLLRPTGDGAGGGARRGPDAAPGAQAASPAFVPAADGPSHAAGTAAPASRRNARCVDDARGRSPVGRL